MLNAEIKSNVLKDLIEIVGTIVDEVKINLDEDGLSLKAVDPAHVAMVDLRLDKEAFETYEAEETELGLNITKIEQFLKLSESGSIIEMEHDEDENRLRMKVNSITQKMPLLDTAGMTDPNVPSLDLPLNLKIKGKHLLNGVKASENISDHVSITANSDGFEIFSEEDEDMVRLSLSEDELEELSANEEVRSLFALDYFSSMVKCVSKDTILDIELGADYPIKIQFDFADGDGNVRYLLAPRIEST
ncbi:MAG: DNA polymerase sliding clamp [Candidatus Thermoplasmatota archaeon]|nr:DNA polymerase sliding clamp [Candidatus Thermoplasmatota archaeon]